MTCGVRTSSVWWLRLGIRIERIKPGKPQQNGRHERMHLTLKKEATRPAGRNFLQQQARFDRFMQDFNFERPHQALNMKYPAELYARSPRPYQGLGELEYPFHDRTLTVTDCGRTDKRSTEGRIFPRGNRSVSRRATRRRASTGRGMMQS
jgi:putative transposase